MSQEEGGGVLRAKKRDPPVPIPPVTSACTSLRECAPRDVWFPFLNLKSEATNSDLFLEDFLN